MTLFRSKAIVIVLCLLPLIPIWYFDYLPLQDYANHLARLTILKNYEHSDFYRQNFTFHFFKGISPLPYLALDFFVTKVVPFLDTDKAMKLFVSLYVILYIFSLYLLAGQLKKDYSLLLLLNLPLMYSSFFYFGFLNFIFSIPLFLLAVWAFERHDATGSTSDIFLMGLLSLLIYLSHIFTLFIFFVFLLCRLFTERRRMREYALILAAVAPSLIFSINYMILSTNFDPAGIVRYESMSNPFFYKFILLLSTFSYLPLDLMVIYFIFFVFSLFLILRNSLFVNKFYIVLSVFLLLAYFVIPLKVLPGNQIDGYYIDVRVFLFSLLLFPFSLQVRDNRDSDFARVILYGLYFMSLWGLLHSFLDFNNNFSAECADRMEERKSVFPINVMTAKSGIRPYNGSSGYFLKRKELLTPNLFTGSHIPLAYKNRPPLLSEFRFNQGDKEEDMKFMAKLRKSYDYVILTGNDPKVEGLLNTVSTEICSDKMVRVYKIEK